LRQQLLAIKFIKDQCAMLQQSSLSFERIVTKEDKVEEKLLMPIEKQIKALNAFS